MEISKLQRTRRALHQIPELGFQEFKTQQLILDNVSMLPQQNIEVQTWRTGVLVRVKGTMPEKTIGFRCDMDGLPIKEETGYEFRSNHEGHMHACGHDFHMTIALGALEKIAAKPVKDHVVFIFQPAEEGPGGAEPLIQSHKFQAWKPDVIFALHIAPELPTGTISTKEGLLFANTSELFIDFKGKGGHAAYPHLTKDMVVAASYFVTQLQQIISRRIDPLDSAVISIGKVTGGFVQNVIAENARLEGTIRTLHPRTMDDIKANIEKLAEGFEISYDSSISIDYGSNYYQVYNDRDWVARFKEIATNYQFKWHDAKAAMTGEDFGYMLRDIPGFMFWFGVNSPYGLHHSKLTPDEDALSIGVHVVETVIRDL